MFVRTALILALNVALLQAGPVLAQGTPPSGQSNSGCTYKYQWKGGEKELHADEGQHVQEKIGDFVCHNGKLEKAK